MKTKRRRKVKPLIRYNIVAAAQAGRTSLTALQEMSGLKERDLIALLGPRMNDLLDYVPFNLDIEPVTWRAICRWLHKQDHPLKRALQIRMTRFWRLSTQSAKVLKCYYFLFPIAPEKTDRRIERIVRRFPDRSAVTLTVTTTGAILSNHAHLVILKPEQVSPVMRWLGWLSTTPTKTEP